MLSHPEGDDSPPFLIEHLHREIFYVRKKNLPVTHSAYDHTVLALYPFVRLSQQLTAPRAGKRFFLYRSICTCRNHLFLFLHLMAPFSLRQICVKDGCPFPWTSAVATSIGSSHGVSPEQNAKNGRLYPPIKNPLSGEPDSGFFIGLNNTTALSGPVVFLPYRRATGRTAFRPES